MERDACGGLFGVAYHWLLICFLDQVLSYFDDVCGNKLCIFCQKSALFLHTFFGDGIDKIWVFQYDYYVLRSN
ncbi:hypothetical protein FD723_25780 [Nostoc sp. C052]|uniref:hypothetical protein n=1 Tax=Nostoc sp. C052 TaxID=2576902 RepID=UPI0015C2FA06|nr:hypothetical protein [Nostoc sp. C052]QLE43517.1 hypothetical protein FD723_25780 [Nostoc sp. C052]